MNYKYELLDLPAQPVISIRTRTNAADLKEILGSLYMSIIQYMDEIGEQPSGPPFVVYYNMDMNDLDIEAGFPVSRTLSDRGQIKMGNIPAGRQVSCVHTGPYSTMEPAYYGLMKYAEDNGYTLLGISYEFYLNDPNITSENELQTKINFPLK